MFVHHSAIQAQGYRTLNEGERVEFDVKQGPKGLQAENVRRAEAKREVGAAAYCSLGPKRAITQAPSVPPTASAGRACPCPLSARQHRRESARDEDQRPQTLRPVDRIA